MPDKVMACKGEADVVPLLVPVVFEEPCGVVVEEEGDVLLELDCVSSRSRFYAAAAIVADEAAASLPIVVRPAQLRP